MRRPTSFDWYELSKIDENKLDINKFSQLIKQAHFGEQLKRVPNSLRQKLLIVFQNASYSIKDKYEQQNRQLQQLKFNKKILAEQIHVMKHDLELSMQKINDDKILIQEKKRIYQKMKQKIKKKEQKQTKQRATTQRSTQTYFCPFCTRDDFASRDQFTFHMFKDHSKNFNEATNGNQGGITSQVKDLILSLKDKQIQLMEMMLNKKKQMETMELQYMYSQEIKKVRSQANFNDRKSDYLTNYERRTRNEQQGEDEQEQQLKGQSQYLFYQKSERANQPQQVKQYEHDYYPNTKIDNSFYQHSDQLNHPRSTNSHRQQHTYQQYNQHSQLSAPLGTERQMRRHIVGQRQNDYYNIFHSDDASSHIQSQCSPQKPNQLVVNKSANHIFGQETLGPNPSLSMPAIARINLNQEIQQPNKNTILNQAIPKSTITIQALENPVQSKIYNYTQNVEIRRPTQSNQSQGIEKKYETVYRTSKSNISQVEQGHIFNSGPLMDDDGDGSDYQDYFRRNGQLQESIDEVIDQQIKIIKPKQHLVPHIKFNSKSQETLNIPLNSNSSSGKPNQNLSVSNSIHTNNHSNMVLQYSKDKSLLDMSHSKQKSSDLIDLSNSFSKRGLESSNNQDQTINLSDLKLSKLEKERQQLKEQVRLAQRDFESQRNMENHSIVQQMPTFSRQSKESKYKPNPSVLQQFKKEEQVQARYERIINRTEKPTSTTKIKLPQNIELLKTKPGVLDQFFVKGLQN